MQSHVLLTHCMGRLTPRLSLCTALTGPDLAQQQLTVSPDALQVADSSGHAAPPQRYDGDWPPQADQQPLVPFHAPSHLPDHAPMPLPAQQEHSPRALGPQHASPFPFLGALFVQLVHLDGQPFASHSTPPAFT